MLIRVIDLETTGFAPPEHHVIEIGFQDVVSRSADLAGAPCDWTAPPNRGTGMLVNPGRPIPPESSAIHHIVDEDVAFAQPWRKVAPEILALPGEFSGFKASYPVDVYAAHSAKVERQWCEDYTGAAPWICTYKCALRLWPDAPSHSNQALRYWRRPAGIIRASALRAHRAYPDAYVTAHLLLDMLETTTVEQLLAWSAQPALQSRCHIGRWRGTPWREVDDGFLHWVLARDFDEDVIFTATAELERREAEEAEGDQSHG